SFFFQAEDGIRDFHVTGVQTCALPISLEQLENAKTAFDAAKQDVQRASYLAGHTAITAPFDGFVLQRPANVGQVVGPGTPVLVRSEERRVGKECRVRWSPCREKKTLEA